MEWLFHNTHGNFAEASSALAALVRDGDPSGHAASLLLPSGMPRSALPARAALLNKATLLLKAKTAMRGGARGGLAAGARQQSSLGSMGAPSESATARELEEAEVMLAVLRLRMRVQGSATSSARSSSSGQPPEGLVPHSPDFHERALACKLDISNRFFRVFWRLS